MWLQKKEAEVNNEAEGRKQIRKDTFFFLFNGGGKNLMLNWVIATFILKDSCLLVCNVCIHVI